MKLLTYEDYYEFDCKYDKPITETDKLKITTGLNIDGHLNYVKIYRKGEKGVYLFLLQVYRIYIQIHNNPRRLKASYYYLSFLYL